MTSNYKAVWAQAGKPSIANVSFVAVSDYHAKLQADKIAQDLGVTHTPRTLTKNNQIIECLRSGVSP